MNIEKLVTRCDILGKEIQFKIENKEIYKTWVGGFLTILLALISLGSIYLFGSEVVFRLKPKLLFKKNILPTYPVKVLNNTKFLYAMRIVDQAGKYIEDIRILEPVLLYEFFKMNNETKELDLVEEETQRLYNCNSSNIDNKTLAEETLSTYFCGKVDNFTIGGDWDHTEIGVLQYSFKLCDKSTEEKYNIKCLNQTEIAKEITFPFVAEIKYINFILDPTKQEKPIGRNYEFKALAVDLENLKKSLIYYSPTTLETDRGYLTEDFITDNFMQLEKIDVDFSKKTDNNKIFMSDIYFTKLQVDYDRSYLKIQDVAATVGGFFSITFYALKFLYFFYVENSLMFYYYKHLFNFYVSEGPSSPIQSPKIKGLREDVKIIPFVSNDKTEANKEDGKDNTNIENSSKQMVNMTSLNNYNNNINVSDIHNTESQNLKGKVKKASASSNPRLLSIITYMDKPKKSIEISESNLWKYKFCFCCMKKDDYKIKTQLIYSANYDIDKRTNTLNFLNLFDHFKVIKQIVLNENQCFMLDKKGKKSITNKIISSENQFTTVLNERENIKEERLVKYLKNKIHEEGLDETDMMLYKMMDEEVQRRVKKETNIDC